MSERSPILATEQGVAATVGVMLFMGGICPDCGSGTRVTSKRWARCKACGRRVQRHELDDRRGPGEGE